MESTLLLEKIRKASRVYVIGNGGSAANADHIANDLLSVGVKAYTLNAAFLTATSNDYGYEYAFSRWLGVVGEKDDLLIALSGSGTSPNIVKGIEAAQRLGMDTYMVTRYLQGRDMQQSEEDQLVIGHELMRALRDR